MKNYEETYRYEDYECKGNEKGITAILTTLNGCILIKTLQKRNADSKGYYRGYDTQHYNEFDFKKRVKDENLLEFISKSIANFKLKKEIEERKLALFMKWYDSNYEEIKGSDYDHLKQAFMAGHKTALTTKQG